MVSEFRGGRYEQTRELDIVDIATLVRADIKIAQRGGLLPACARIRVRVDRPRDRIWVVIDGMPDTWTYNQPGREPDYANRVPTHGGHTPAAVAAVREVKRIASAYNRDDSDPQADYHNKRFRTHVEITDETSQRLYAQRAALNAEIAARPRRNRRHKEGQSR